MMSRTVWPAAAFAALTLASTLLYVTHEQVLGIVGYVISGITLVMLLARGRN